MENQGLYEPYQGSIHSIFSPLAKSRGGWITDAVQRSSQIHAVQYIPSKRHRLGIKFYVLCDCGTGYILDYAIYSASDVDIDKNDPNGFSGFVVKLLIKKYSDPSVFAVNGDQNPPR